MALFVPSAKLLGTVITYYQSALFIVVSHDFLYTLFIKSIGMFQSQRIKKPINPCHFLNLKCT